MISSTQQQPLSNAQLANTLEEVADLLEAQGANPFRVRAYRGTAQTLRQLKQPAHQIERVPVEELLDVDEAYRRLAAKGRLPRIAPKRFNPTGDAWLPVLHTQRGNRHYTALFSNTARAHELGTTHDWVVIYQDDEDHGRWTVITAQYGRLRGRRLVRGHEQQCAKYYETAAAPTATVSATVT